MAIDKNYNRELEYRRAQEAGVEANEIGRDTLQKQHNQQEMLRDTAKKNRGHMRRSGQGGGSLG